MRKIGSVSDQTQGATLGAYLYGEGIANDIDPTDDGDWVVWIHSDEHLEEARKILGQFQLRPDDPVFKAGAEEGKEKIREEESKDERFRKNFYDRSRVFKRWRYGLVTLFLVGCSVLVSLFTKFGENDALTSKVYITSVEFKGGGTYSYDPELPEIRSGQVWRLILPIFLHLDILHLLFNMMWTLDLGTLLERRHGSLGLLLFVLLIGAVSNFMQFLWNGPLFGGMSGVVYGLLGYLWIRGKVDPFYEIHLRRNIVIMMIIWFFLCMTPVINAANMAHGAGLGIGMMAGYVSGIMAKSRRYRRD